MNFMVGFSLRGRCKKGRERGREKSTKEGKGKAAPAIRAGVFVIRPPFSQLIRQCHCQYVTNHKYGASQHGPNLITLFTGNCQVETLFSSDIIIERNKTFLLFLLPQQTRQT